MNQDLGYSLVGSEAYSNLEKGHVFFCWTDRLQMYEIMLVRDSFRITAKLVVEMFVTVASPTVIV